MIVTDTMQEFRNDLHLFRKRVPVLREPLSGDVTQAHRKTALSGHNTTDHCAGRVRLFCTFSRLPIRFLFTTRTLRIGGAASSFNVYKV